jgi:hypothetical protein
MNPPSGQITPSLALGLAGAWPSLSRVLQDTSGGALPVHSARAPDRITPIIQWLFQRSPWVMWGGVFLGLLVLAALWRWVWPRRAEIARWLVTRSRAAKVGLFSAAGIAVVVAGGAGFKSYEFVETDSRFCNGCHIFVPSGQPLTPSDTGFYTVVPRLEGKHDTLTCHTCHPLKPMKEAVKLFFWMSGVRGDSIPPHAKVPRAICEQCHVRGSAKETWQAIAATAGHRTHLESDSLKGKIECLTCHARTAHRFVPVNQTCGQAGCHSPEQTRIVLGKMTSQGPAATFHCQACHDFIATVPRLATRDSAAGTLRPSLQQCFACHAMKERLPDFDAARDPHKGTCGMCHNPHVQTKPIEAAQSCATAKCHADWRSVPFHTGLHRKVAQDCILCHQPHAARVDGSDCTGCHERVRKVRPNFRPPLPFDTLKALQSSMLPPDLPPADTRPQKPKGDGPPLEEPTARAHAPLSWQPAEQPADSFPHARHRKLACLTCHLAAGSKGRLTFEPPRGCQICHHQSPGQRECTMCHEEGKSPPAEIPTQLTIAVPREDPLTRPVDFRHEIHAKLTCTRCHTTPVTLEPADSVRSCHACHADHHASGRSCATCHKTETITTAHKRPEFAHLACATCHTPARIAALTPTRSFCLVCHDKAQDHHPPKECTACHFLRTPEQFQAELARGGAP